MIAHVDDLLYTGNVEFLALVKKTISQFRVGEVEMVTHKKGLMFTGLEIQKGPNGCMVLSQETYVNELPIMDISEYVTQNGAKKEGELKSTSRQGLGLLIWAHQTRPDVGFLITKLATDMIHACGDGNKAKQWCNLYNKTVRFLKRHASKIHYHPEPKSSEHLSWKDRLKHYRIVSFTDAGFASLEGEHSVESNLLVFGRALFRDGVIHCHGYLIDRKCAKIQRVCRSSLAAECHAAVTAGDYALWYQVLLIEIFTHRYEIRRICPPTDCPMLGPFAESPSDSQLKADRLFWTNLEDQWNPAIKLSHEDVLWNYSKCESCQVNFPLQTAEKNHQAEMAHGKIDFILFRPLLLTDCCSLYSSILRMQPNANERCARIILAHLRDLQSLLTISFLDATANLGDVGTKHGGNKSLLLDFLLTGRFVISFAGRKGKSPSTK